MRSVYLRQLKKLLDVWSVPHFLFGVVIATGAIAFTWPLGIVCVGMLIMAVLWEGVERWLRIQERPGNAWMDIILPLLAFGLTFLLVDQAPLHEEQQQGLFVSALGLFLFVNAAAWKARRERDRDFLQ